MSMDYIGVVSLFDSVLLLLTVCIDFSGVIDLEINRETHSFHEHFAVTIRTFLAAIFQFRHQSEARKYCALGFRVFYRNHGHGIDWYIPVFLLFLNSNSRNPLDHAMNTDPYTENQGPVCLFAIYRLLTTSDNSSQSSIQFAAQRSIRFTNFKLFAKINLSRTWCVN
ncbi:hypothetical protein BJ912DRAFT_982843 [Pholiota molesta]|nr:hypothetical protein BJ912DRAFT_982843 [Pholiota molesta]